MRSPQLRLRQIKDAVPRRSIMPVVIPSPMWPAREVRSVWKTFSPRDRDAVSRIVAEEDGKAFLSAHYFGFPYQGWQAISLSCRSARPTRSPFVEQETEVETREQHVASIRMSKALLRGS
jgi:hypothetical protein